ncbi:hypothetical protein [Acinetobacter phage A2.1]|nr:hypothetical protein BphiR1888_00058 [Acinetobacter phage Bphi-R1888]WNT46426.1 hypothetical protein [Acinetobacter phage A2.1]WNT46511.1 hypothetical protein [Acinetobacter phage A832.1]
MKIEEIRANAPKGATHYIEYAGVTYFKSTEYGLHIYSKMFGEWILDRRFRITELKPL